MDNMEIQTKFKIQDRVLILIGSHLQQGVIKEIIIKVGILDKNSPPNGTIQIQYSVLCLNDSIYYLLDQDEVFKDKQEMIDRISQ